MTYKLGKPLQSGLYGVNARFRIRAGERITHAFSDPLYARLSLVAWFELRQSLCYSLERNLGDRLQAG